jgi:hypothetical protein
VVAAAATVAAVMVEAVREDFYLAQYQLLRAQLIQL